MFTNLRPFSEDKEILIYFNIFSLKEVTFLSDIVFKLQNGAIFNIAIQFLYTSVLRFEPRSMTLFQ